jgi:glutamine amidotransferase
MRIAVIDYKAGNLRNVQKAIESLGAESEVISQPEGLNSFQGIILPGVGHFRNGMDSLNDSGLSDAIISEAKDSKTPLMGICLGMQLLAKSGEEGGFTKGLGLLPMRVKRFDMPNNEERLPHMGWNNIKPQKESILFKNIPNNSDFYFAHSYHVVLDDENLSAAICDYAYTFPVAVESGNIFATQFHPEKSQRFGGIVLKNFLSYCAKE